jgi:hypothetical protein
MEFFHMEEEKKLRFSIAPPIHCKVLHFILYKLNIFGTEPLNKLLIK